MRPETIAKIRHVLPDETSSHPGIYVDLESPYRGSAHSPKPGRYLNTVTFLTGVARRVHNDHENLDHRRRNPAAHYCDYGESHPYAHVFSMTEQQVADALGIPLSTSPSEDFAWHSLEAIDILLSGYYPDEDEPVNQEAALLEVQTARLKELALNRTQARDVNVASRFLSS